MVNKSKDEVKRLSRHFTKIILYFYSKTRLNQLPLKIKIRKSKTGSCIIHSNYFSENIR